MRKYLVIYEQSANGYSAYVPDLPGCVAADETKEGTEQLIYDAIQFHLEGMLEDGLPIPEAKTEAATVMIPEKVA